MGDQDPGVTVPPTEPVAGTLAATAPEEPASGSEPVTNPVEPKEQTVPFTRFQEVNDKAKTAEEEARTLREENEQLKQQTAPQTPQNDDEIDPEVEKMLDGYAKKRGLVSKEDLDSERNRLQVQQDVNTLTATPPVPGIPYEHQAVMDYAKANGLPITSKAALQAAYKELNWDKIVEVERQRAIESYKTAGTSGAEQPGSPGPAAPSEPEITGKSTKDRTRERIRIARQKLA